MKLYQGAILQAQEGEGTLSVATDGNGVSFRRPGRRHDIGVQVCLQCGLGGLGEW